MSLNNPTYRYIKIAGIPYRQQSYDEGKSWHTVVAQSGDLTLPTGESMPVLPPVNITIMGSAQAPVRNRERFVRRKKWGPRALGRAPEGRSLLKTWRRIEKDRLLADLSAALPRLQYLGIDWARQTCPKPVRAKLVLLPIYCEFPRELCSHKISAR